MATNSFDVTTGVDLQEVDNAVNQARKEVGQRFDFKGSPARLELDRTAGVLHLEGEDEYRLGALWDILRGRLAKRGVPLKNLHRGDVQRASSGRARQEISLVQGLSTETAKEVARTVKGLGLKKVQASVQGDAVRVSGPSRDDLQKAIAALRSRDFGVELRFGNYR